jgi:hypothetical protein
MDGRSWTCATIAEIARIVAGYGWPRYKDLIGDWGIGEHPFWRYDAPDATHPAVISFRAACESHRNKHRWIVYDDCGLIIPLWWIKETLYREEGGGPYFAWRRHVRGDRDEISTDWSVFRGHSGVGRGKRRRWSVYRYPRTMQEIREQERACEELAEYDIKARPRRNLPDARDDFARSNWNAKNWKRHRRTQYRVRRGS